VRTRRELRALDCGFQELFGGDFAHFPQQAGRDLCVGGADACTSWLPVELERDPRGYLCTGRDLTTWKLDRHPFPLETSLPGVFCAGDARHNSIKRVSSGVGEGSMAIAAYRPIAKLAISLAVESAKSG
jgi:hypothetical protein